ncbi:MAG: carbohydrate porin [Cyclobacteriaceae bacterium]
MKQIFCSFFLASGFWIQAQSDSLKLKEAPVNFELAYSAQPWVNLSGGVDQGFVYVDNVDFAVDFRLKNLGQEKSDLMIFLYGLGNNGGAATSLMGDFQVASNIETDPAWRLYEAWAQYNLLHGQFSLLAGLYDLNSEFDVLEPGLLFVNSSFGIGAEYAQTGENGPSIFPVSSLAFRANIVANDHLQFRVGILDGLSGDPTDVTRNNIDLSKEDGALLIFESSIFTSRKESNMNSAKRSRVGRENEPERSDKLNIGCWYYTAAFEEIGLTSTARGNFGVYFGYQKYHYEWSFFGRYGMANERFNRFGSALSGGVLCSSVFSSLEDQIGLAFSSGFSGESYQNRIEDKYLAETAIELTYAVAPFDWLNIQPDIQYIIHPDTRADLKNALAVALLVQVSL